MQSIVEMTEEDKQNVLTKLEWEGGFDYFVYGSDFPEYTDPEFRRLVSAYRKATNELQDFLGELEEEEG